MTTTDLPLPDGNLFAVSDRLILVEQVQALTAIGLTVYGHSRQPFVSMTLQGRINNTTIAGDVTVGLSLEALDTIVDVLLHNRTFLAKALKEYS